MRLSPVSAHHRVQEFRTGSAYLDYYLKHAARRELERGHSATYVLTPSEDPGRVLGYYTLMELRFELEMGPMPGALISHLGVDRRLRYRGHGRRLLRSALLRSVRSAPFVTWGVVAHASTPALHAFYRRHGFKELLDYPERLFHFPQAVRASAVEALGPAA